MSQKHSDALYTQFNDVGRMLGDHVFERPEAAIKTPG